MEFCLFFVEPGLAQIVNVAVVAAFRPVVKRPVQVMTAATGFVFCSQTRIIVQRRTMVPDYTGGHLGTGRPEVTLDAVAFEVMT